MKLTKAQILAVGKRRTKDLEVPELGGEITLTNLSADAALTLKELARTGEGTTREMTVVMFSTCILDETGEAMFSPEEAAALSKKISVETLNLLISEISELSGRKLPGMLVVQGGAVVQNGATQEAAPVNPSVAAESVSSPTA